MLEFACKELGIDVTARCRHPTIYLDHWAWRRFSENPTLAARLATAIKNRNGTLAISWLNLVEFCRMRERRQAGEADALLDAVLPNIFFIDVDFGKVIDREDSLLAGANPLPPHADTGLFEEFIRSHMRAHDSLNLLRASDIYRLAQETGLKPRYDGLASSVKAQIETMVKDPRFQRTALRTPQRISIQRGTRVILRELLCSYARYPNREIDVNDVADVGHAVVPLAYCDYLLLDGHWEAQARTAKSRIRQARMSFPMATVFSPKEIERFLQELET